MSLFAIRRAQTPGCRTVNRADGVQDFVASCCHGPCWQWCQKGGSIGVVASAKSEVPNINNFQALLESLPAERSWCLALPTWLCQSEHPLVRRIYLQSEINWNHTSMFLSPLGVFTMLLTIRSCRQTGQVTHCHLLNAQKMNISNQKVTKNSLFPAAVDLSFQLSVVVRSTEAVSVHAFLTLPHLIMVGWKHWDSGWQGQM